MATRIRTTELSRRLPWTGQPALPRLLRRGKEEADWGSLGFRFGDPSRCRPLSGREAARRRAPLRIRGPGFAPAQRAGARTAPRSPLAAAGLPRGDC